MIVVMNAGSTEEQLNKVISGIEEMGYKAHVMRGVERNVIGCLGDERGKSALKSLETFEGVETVMPILSPYKLAGKQLQAKSTVVKIAEGVEVGGDNLLVIAGPCSVESEEQINTIASFLSDLASSMYSASLM